MTSSHTRGIAAALLAAAVAACGGHRSVQTAPQPVNGSQGDLTAIAKARTDSARHRYTDADVQFMTGMIAHHTQAIVMARWAPTHDASPAIRTLSGRIINAQNDEIALMKQWLRDRGLPVPDIRVDGYKVMMVMDGMAHEHMMPGMLTDAQMAQLDSARGPEFDRLFLTFMIQHHKGAVSMVKELIGSPGGALDDTVFKLASDINVDQTTEIDRMQKMLVTLLLEPPTQ